ncbi:MAG TPA: DUF167 domain-containing protein [Nitrososphaeraceae archaeon]|nr:DUF167 domain-containing protein [Nitrososphaeraceae archaeon]
MNLIDKYNNNLSSVYKMKYLVTVSFNSSDFFHVENNEIKISLKSKPELGKANRELIKSLSEHFKISTNKIKILSGFSSRKKVVEILF